MSIATTAIGTVVIVLVMALVTLVTRWGGMFIMSFVPISRRVERFISAMAGSVLIALVAPLALEGDTGARLALLTTAIMMFLFRRPLPAIAAGVLAAALYRRLVPLG